MARALIWLLLAPVFAALAVIGVRMARAPEAPPAPAGAALTAQAASSPADVLPEPRDAPPSTPGLAARCGEGPAAAAAANQASLSTASWSAFGRLETGWQIYAPMAAAEIGAPPCDGGSPGFAAALAVWQGAHRLAATGVMDEATLRAMAVTWALRRPFVQLNRTGVCPAPPPDQVLETATPAEVYGGRAIRLRRSALEALRRMQAAARAEVPVLAQDKAALTLMSGFRDPAEEAARCADGGCDNVVRSPCSAHRTGLAADLYLGAAPGLRPDTTDDVNRLWQTRTPAYRWLVANAGRFGFVNYPFEPWHWEWTGEPVAWTGGG